MKKNSPLHISPHFKKIGVAFFFLTLSNIAFFFLNFSYFSNDFVIDIFISILWGLAFQLSAFLTINLPLFVLLFFSRTIYSNRIIDSINNILFYAVNSIAISLNIIDSGYFPFTLKRLSADFFDLVLSNQDEFNFLLWDFIRDYPVHFFILIIFNILFISFARKYPLGQKTQRRFLFQRLLLNLLYAALIVLFIRGPFVRPLSIVDAGRHSTAHLIPLVLNSPFTVLHSIGYKSLKPKEFYPEEELNRLFSPEHPGDREHRFIRKNVVIIILESFSKEFSAYLNPRIRKEKAQGYMPFLDSLMRQSLVFDGYANGKTSVEGIPSVVSGLPSLMDKALIFSTYSSNQIQSIASYLKKEGYYSAFFHGGTNGTMNFEPFAKNAGFDDYFGRSEYDNDADFDGNWGIFDEPFLQFMAKKLDAFPKPFDATVFTLSSHHPYTIPAPYKNTFTGGKLPIMKSIEYADFALRKFFETISTKEWFHNTIFVFSADHTAVSADKFFKNSLGQYAIPIFIYDPKTPPFRSHKIIQQTDILPSVLDYLHYPYCSFAFGQSVFDTTRPHFSVNYRNGIYQMITDSLYANFDGQSLKITKLFEYPRDSLLRHNKVRKDPTSAKRLERLIKAYVQQYNERMIHNRLGCNSRK